MRQILVSHFEIVLISFWWGGGGGCAPMVPTPMLFFPLNISSCGWKCVTFSSGPHIIEGPRDLVLNVGDDVILNCRLLNYESATNYVNIDWIFIPSDGSSPRTYRWRSGEFIIRYLQYQRYTTTLSVGPATLNSSGTYSCLSYNSGYADAVFANATVEVFREYMCVCVYTECVHVEQWVGWGVCLNLNHKDNGLLSVCNRVKVAWYIGTEYFHLTDCCSCMNNGKCAWWAV